MTPTPGPIRLPSFPLHLCSPICHVPTHRHKGATTTMMRQRTQQGAVCKDSPQKGATQSPAAAGSGYISPTISAKSDASLSKVEPELELVDSSASDDPDEGPPEVSAAKGGGGFVIRYHSPQEPPTAPPKQLHHSYIHPDKHFFILGCAFPPSLPPDGWRRQPSGC